MLLYGPISNSVPRRRAGPVGQDFVVTGRTTHPLAVACILHAVAPGFNFHYKAPTLRLPGEALPLDASHYVRLSIDHLFAPAVDYIVTDWLPYTEFKGSTTSLSAACHLGLADFENALAGHRSSSRLTRGRQQVTRDAPSSSVPPETLVDARRTFMCDWPVAFVELYTGNT